MSFVQRINKRKRGHWGGICLTNPSSILKSYIHHPHFQIRKQNWNRSNFIWTRPILISFYDLYLLIRYEGQWRSQTNSNHSRGHCSCNYSMQILFPQIFYDFGNSRNIQNGNSGVLRWYCTKKKTLNFFWSIRIRLFIEFQLFISHCRIKRIRKKNSSGPFLFKDR